ncbi:MAG: ATP-binding cassette domain-containing protein [Cytophagales bacterium]|nr:ATP-binding cassette domain-containing protein [Cytophagales bacterium]
MENNYKKSSDIGGALRRILALLWLDKEDITAIYIYSIFAGLVSLSLPLGIQTIIGFVQAGSISTSIVVLIGLVLTGTFISGFLQVKQLELIEKIEQKLFVRYALEYTKRLPFLNIQKLDRAYLPELINRFFDVASLQKSLHKLLVDIPTALIQILFGILLLSFYHPLFIAFGGLLMLIIFLIIRFSSNKGFQSSLETSDYKYKVAGWLEEMARGIKTFKYAKKTSLHMNKMDNLVTGYLGARTTHFGVLKVQYWSLITFKLIIVGAMLVLGVILLVDQQINIGQFVASDIVIIVILNSIEKLIGNMDQIYEALTSVEKLDKVAKAEIEVSGKEILEEVERGISVEMRNVEFGYSDEETQLQNFNMSVDSGEWLFLYGESGSGKTSVLRLLTGSFKHRKGEILLEGLPIGNYSNKSIKKETGFLLGRQNIFEGTLLENLTLSDKEVSVSHVLKICQMTGLSEYIESKPTGLETMLDPFGKSLSAKTRRQILLVRAILTNHRLLLLEEPFRFLSESQLKETIAFLKALKTTVVVASADPGYEKFCDKKVNL